MRVTPRSTLDRLIFYFTESEPESIWTCMLSARLVSNLGSQFLISYSLISYSLTNILIISIILSAIIGASGGLNQASLRKFIAYSSLNHLTWLLSSILINNLLSILYFSLCSLLSFAIIFIFNTFKVSHIKQQFPIFTNWKIVKIYIIFKSSIFRKVTSIFRVNQLIFLFTLLIFLLVLLY